MTITVEPDPAHPAGHALIRVPGAAQAAGAPGFRIQREEDWDEDRLGPAGWQSSDALLTPDRAESSGADLVLHVGWSVCRHLEAGVYTVEVPASGQPPAPAFWPDITPMHAGAVDINTRAAAPEPTPPAIKPGTPNPAPLSADLGDEAVPAAPAAASASNVLIRGAEVGIDVFRPARILLLIVLIAAAGGGYYFWTHRPAEIPSATQTSPPAPPETAPPRISLTGLSVPEVITRAPNPAAIAEEGASRLRGDRRNDGFALLDAAADRNDPSALAALARLYDPVLFQPGGPIPKPDPRQAARYYRDAARAGADVAAPREALRQSLETRAQSGDLSANLSLKDFWP